MVEPHIIIKMCSFTNNIVYNNKLTSMMIAEKFPKNFRPRGRGQSLTGRLPVEREGRLVHDEGPRQPEDQEGLYHGYHQEEVVSSSIGAM